MNTERLAEMVNHIAANFVAEPDHAVAVETMVVHLQRFWEPRMRHQIVMHQRAGHGGLVPLADEVIVELGRRLDQTPPPPIPKGGGDAG